MKKRLFTNNRPLFFITLCLTFIFWLFLLMHIVSTQFFTPSQKAIPAFLNTSNNQSYYLNTAYTLDKSNSELTLLNETTVRLPVSYFCDKNTNQLSDKQMMLTFLKKHDKQIRLISCHEEKNYTDLYFFSPKISHSISSPLTGNFNLQIAVTQKYVYLGLPLIQYDF